MTRSVMIVAGGTGGHVYPGLAVAEVLTRAGVDLHWIGTRRGIEARVVPLHDIPLTLIPVAGLRRSGWLRWLGAPFTLFAAVASAIGVITRVRPQVVLGMGGFVSGPAGVAAWLCRRPLVIHEQNAIPGLTNRLLSRIARRVLEAVPGTFPPRTHAVATGNPVRAAIAALPLPRVRLAGHAALKVLVFGGSRGARALNEIVPCALGASSLPGLHVLHQCGEHDVDATRARYATEAPALQVEVTPYIDDMATAYANADLVIARAGALTIAEIAACGVASILVPYPYAVDDHQSANARYLERNDAAVLIAEAELSVARLAATIDALGAEPARLIEMAERARALAAGDAADLVARHCLEFVDA